MVGGLAVPSSSMAGGLLSGRSFVLAGEGCETRYAAHLLAALGAGTCIEAGPADLHPALAWARSGLMWLTGAPRAPGKMLPSPVGACANGVLKALAALGAHLPPAWRQADIMLAHRAALLGLRRQGPVSPGGSCRLLQAADGMLAVNLARAEDWELVPAWMGAGVIADWAQLASGLAAHTVETALEGARLLGLPVAAADLLPRDGIPWCRAQSVGVRSDRARRRRAPRVIDLSSLWAGPLCTQILRQLGASVIKVESTRRPDGARAGNQDFFDVLNAGKTCVAIDFSSAGGVARLRRLIETADIVIEASRPRALRQLGIDAEGMLADNPGLSWISITGHGREEPGAGWVAFGDDAGVGGGLSSVLARATGEWAFCGDAIADPLTGLHAALAAWCAHAAGGGSLVSLAMRDVVECCAAWERTPDDDALDARMRHWQGLSAAGGLLDCRPQRPILAGPARAHGADNTALDELLAC
ncbi:MAG: CoA transferase [Phycisphaerae bacterium]|nr:CoA transferase [Phycisphaerae bacterium]